MHPYPPYSHAPRPPYYQQHPSQYPSTPPPAYSYSAWPQAAPQPSNAGAKVAFVVLGGMGCAFLGFVALLIVLIVIGDRASQREAAAAAANETPAGKVDSARLDAKTACALLEKELKNGLRKDDGDFTSINCSASTFEGDDHRATLRGVEALSGTKRSVLTGCFVRSTRWFGLTALEGAAETCPTLAVTPPTAPKAATEEDLRTEENAIRAVLLEQESTTAFVKVATLLGAVRTNLAKGAPIPTTCPALHDTEVSRLDAQLEEGWLFLTSAEVMGAMVATVPSPERKENALRILSVPYLAAFVSDERTLPSLRAKKKAGRDYNDGRFKGRLVLVDTKLGKPVCAGPLEFESSEKVKLRRNATEDERQNTLELDFEQNFRRASDSALKDLTGGHVTFRSSLSP